MDHERKRAYSQAAQPPSKRVRQPPVQADENIVGPFTSSPPSTFFAPPTFLTPNKENEFPIFPSKDYAPGAPFKHTLSDVHPTKPSSLCGPPLSDILNFGEFEMPDNLLSGQPVLGSSPPGLAFDQNSSPQDMLGMYLDSEPGPVMYENQDIVMNEQLVPTGPPTPSDLNFQDLSLLDLSKGPLSIDAARPVAQHNRASVFVMQSTVFEACFPTMHPNEVVIFFDKGAQVIKLSKYPLCAASRFFTQLLDGPFMDSHTRCIRLRDDFPYAVKAMLQFIDAGIYVFDPAMYAQFPNITLLDLHIHAYLAGEKYAVAGLCEYAITQYINLGEMILSGNPAVNHPPGSGTPPQHGTTMPLTYSPFDSPSSDGPAQVYDALLNSFVLLWRNTDTRHDAMRAAVLELIKHGVNQLLKVEFFSELMMGLVGFGDDVVQSLEEDGLDVGVYLGLGGMAAAGGVRFGGRV